MQHNTVMNLLHSTFNNDTYFYNMKHDKNIDKKLTVEVTEIGD